MNILVKRNFPVALAPMLPAFVAGNGEEPGGETKTAVGKARQGFQGFEPGGLQNVVGQISVAQGVD